MHSVLSLQNRENGTILPFPWDPQATRFSASGEGGFVPARGSVPGPRWGLCPQTPIIGSRFALAMCPPNFHDFPQVLEGWINTALADPEIYSVSQNLKVGHMTYATPLLSPNFAFFD